VAVLLDTAVLSPPDRAEAVFQAMRSATAPCTVIHERAGEPVSIAAARRWGFVDPTHFGRRFRAAYGLSPGEWRRAAREAALRRPPEPC